MNARRRVCWAVVGFLACMALRPAAAEQPDSRRWEADIRAFEASDRANPPPQDAILFVGSSTIRFWKTLAQDFPEHKVLNRGFGGCQIADCTYYADRIVIPYRPRLIVLRAGGNDIAAGKTPEQVRDDFRAFVKKVRAKLPQVRIAYMTINASPARWANVDNEKKANWLIRDVVVQGENLDYIDTFGATLGSDGRPREDLFVKDRLHFNAEGYKILAAQVRSHLTPPRQGRIHYSGKIACDTASTAPGEEEIMGALDQARPLPSRIPFLRDVRRINVRIVVETLADYLDPPKELPVVGLAQLHRVQYKCIVYFTEVTRVVLPVPSEAIDDDCEEVVYIDKEHLHVLDKREEIIKQEINEVRQPQVDAKSCACRCRRHEKTASSMYRATRRPWSAAR